MAETGSGYCRVIDRRDGRHCGRLRGVRLDDGHDNGGDDAQHDQADHDHDELVGCHPSAGNRTHTHANSCPVRHQRKQRPTNQPSNPTQPNPTLHSHSQPSSQHFARSVPHESTQLLLCEGDVRVHELDLLVDPVQLLSLCLHLLGGRSSDLAVQIDHHHDTAERVSFGTRRRRRRRRTGTGESVHPRSLRRSACCGPPTVLTAAESSLPSPPLPWSRAGRPLSAGTGTDTDTDRKSLSGAAHSSARLVSDGTHSFRRRSLT